MSPEPTLPAADSTDVLVVGAGVVGLSVARALALAGLEVIVVERHKRVGEETSSRNSGVIHSGIYYPTASAKARLCVRGRDLLYAYCAEKGIAHRRCGKIIVAQASETEKLRGLLRQAALNGVTDLTWLDAAQVRELEPQVRADAGLLCPSTGIVDVHEYMTALHGDLEQHRGSVVFDTELVRVQVEPTRIHAQLRTGHERSHVNCRWLINAAGLHAVDVLRRIEGFPAARIPQRHFAKGNYFDCAGPSPFRRLVYPMPASAGLGIHATLDLAGKVRFGPDVEWIDEIDYAVDAARSSQFYAAIRTYWPSLRDGALTPSYAGVRPKLTGPNEPAADFRIETPREHGVDGIVNLLGIESPGLTASLAIGSQIAGELAASRP
ncbi:MAG TPA: NAD(P)/FAD-dependent oxidoreductase [Steroidobacteraceae bacterium]|nr:NAD(P)/FAD-dependent oxidoreductase [Steroidobacteraceae bacterium]